MPNYAYTAISVDPKDFHALISLSNGNKVCDFNTVIPMPRHGATFFANGDIGEKEREKFGKDNWYDWSIANWGTKWNACNAELIEETSTLRFDTAWSFPEPVLFALSKKFPNVLFKARLGEESDAFAGYMEFKEGKVVKQFDLSEHTPRNRMLRAVLLNNFLPDQIDVEKNYAFWVELQKVDEAIFIDFYKNWAKETNGKELEALSFHEQLLIKNLIAKVTKQPLT